MFGITFILMQIRILDKQWKKFNPFSDPDLGHKLFFKILILLIKEKSNFYSFSVFMLKLDEPFRIRNILIITFFTSSDLGFRTKRFYLQFLVDTLTLGTGSVDPHFGWYFDPWNRICGSAFFCGSKSRKPTYCGSL